MRWLLLALAGTLSLISFRSAGEGAGASSILQPLTLAESWRLAEAGNPTLLSKQAQVAAAEGLRTEAFAFLNDNPELALQGTRRSVPRGDSGTERHREWSVGVSQAVEIAGQPALRRRAADAALDALRAEVQDVRRQVRVDVAQQFYRVLAQQDRLEVERQALRLFETTAAAIEKRRAAGEDTRLDANFAAVEAERAQSQVGVAAEQLLSAQSDLAARLNMPPGHLPRAVGDVTDLPPTPRYTLDRLLATAEGQPRLRALAAREESARARLSLERARRYPDVTLGLSVGREGASDAREHLTTLSVSVPLPLFKRNDAAIGQATTELTQAEIDRRSTSRNLVADVQVLTARLQSLQERVQRLRRNVLPRLEDNVQLSIKSRDAGQIGLLELITVHRQALDARRDLIEALTDYHSTRLSLELAAGISAEDMQ